MIKLILINFDAFDPLNQPQYLLIDRTVTFCVRGSCIHVSCSAVAAFNFAVGILTQVVYRHTGDKFIRCTDYGKGNTCDRTYS